jgi:hypothetical protein
MKICILCGCAVRERDTYGDIYSPICFDCHWGMVDEYYSQDWYGVAPHTHDLTKTGSFIGSTVLKDLTDRLNENGEFDCGNGLFFRPDPDAPGLGVYSRRR